MRNRRAISHPVLKQILLAFSVVCAFCLVVAANAAKEPEPQVCAHYADLSVNLPPLNLTLVAANGTFLVLDSADIGSLPSYEARGGYKNQLGYIRGLGNYTGVPMITLCNMVGGLGTGDKIRVTASDGYNMTFSYDQANGNFSTYDPVTGDPVSHSQALTLIVAYYKDGLNISSSEGPLRLSIVGPEGLATDSVYWIKWVVKVEVLPGQIPEFSSITATLLFMLLTVVTTVSYRRTASGTASELRKRY